MKIIIADFNINQYGGIISYVASMLKAFRDLGHTADVATLAPSSISQNSYQKKIKEFENGDFDNRIAFGSQSGGYEKDEVTGYWRNNHYGYFLPPSNRIGVFEKNAVERWKELVKDVDIILWNFMPTKSSTWDKKGIQFNFWEKFFDLPSEIKQVFLVHDAYFNVRASNISAFKEKILFLGCAHLAAYHCCSEIGIPRTLLLNPRYLSKNEKMPLKMMDKRSEDFFSAHVFKSMKHMDDLVAAIPYLQKNEDNKFKVKISGSGVEYFYMNSKTNKVKSKYMCSVSRDPDLPAKLEGKISLWKRAERFGMEYTGNLPISEVVETLKNTKFAIDPSWSKHYAQYCRTHINGFIIEAMLCGAYPVLRDYRGLDKNVNPDDIYDPLFENIKAIIIPWDATPKQFAEKLKQAMKMSSSQFLKDTKHNFDLVNELFNARKNAEEIIRLAKGGKKLVKKELEVGEDSETVKKITKEIMEDFYGIKLPIQWETD